MPYLAAIAAKRVVFQGREGSQYNVVDDIYEWSTVPQLTMPFELFTLQRMSTISEDFVQEN